MKTAERPCGVATDEMCQCGHLKSQHNELVITKGSKIYSIAEGGSCSCCNCARFRWTKFVKSFLGKVCPSWN
jgi:hypothetical protein